MTNERAEIQTPSTIGRCALRTAPSNFPLLASPPSVLTLDTNFIGIPKEGVGVSNNPKIGMGGPRFNDSVFTLNTKEIELTIAMKYL